MRKGAGRSRMRSCPTQRSGLGVRRDLLPVQGSLSAKGAAIPAPSHGLRAASDAGRQFTADRRLPVGRMQSTRSRPPLTPAPPAPTVWGESGKGKCRMVTGVEGGRAAACPDPRPGPRGDRSRRRRPQLGCYQRPACPPDRCRPERAPPTLLARACTLQVVIRRFIVQVLVCQLDAMPAAGPGQPPPPAAGLRVYPLQVY
jgi:hypothetical protein